MLWTTIPPWALPCSSPPVGGRLGCGSISGAAPSTDGADQEVTSAGRRTKVVVPRTATDLVIPCASRPLGRWKVPGAISALCVARERVARRSRHERVILLTLERSPRGRPLWLCRRHGSQRWDSSGRSAAPQPSDLCRSAPQPPNVCRSTPQSSIVCGAESSDPRMKTGRRGPAVVAGLSSSSHLLVSDFVRRARRCYGQAPRGTGHA